MVRLLPIVTPFTSLLLTPLPLVFSIVPSLLTNVPLIIVPLRLFSPPELNNPALPMSNVLPVLVNVPVRFTEPPALLKVPNPAVVNVPPRLSVPADTLNVPALLHAPAMFNVVLEPESPIVPAVTAALVIVDVPEVKPSVPPDMLNALKLLDPLRVRFPAAITKLPLLLSEVSVVVPETPLS